MSLDDLRTPVPPSGAEAETPVRRVDRPSSQRDKVTRAEELRLQLADEIVRGVLPPGSALDETDIARRFSVSRTPVREALRQLVASGLVEARAHRGAVVAQPRAAGEIARRTRPRRGRDHARRQGGCSGRHARPYRTGARGIRALRGVSVVVFRDELL